MPRAVADRPSRRLDAILSTLKRHGVEEFEAAELEGIGKGLKWKFREPKTAQEPGNTHTQRVEAGTTVPVRRERQPPKDELDIVIEGRDEPLDADELPQ